MGALPFGRGKSPFPPASCVNKVLELAKLLEFVKAVEKADEIAFPVQVKDLIQSGTSLVGARPKNVVEAGEELWIAKFPSRQDRWNTAWVEASMFALARECNIHSCDHRIVSIGEDDVLVVRRFDRVRFEGGYLHHRFVSGVTVLDAGETIGDRSRWSYPLLFEELHRRTHRPAEDLRDLFARMCFNALISNTDEHPRNHGLVAPGHDFELAAAYDLARNPLISVERRDLASSWDVTTGTRAERTS